MHDRRLATVLIEEDEEADLGLVRSDNDQTHERAILPSCALKEDRRLVDEAAARLKALAFNTMVKGVADMGNYLLDTFYNGDPELYRSAAPGKHATLRLLLERCESVEIPVSRSLLARALMIAVRIREMPRNSVFSTLPPSHQAELVRIRSTEKIERLAERARSDGMSVIRLRAAVRRAIPKSNRGRKPTPTVLRVLETCVRGLRDDETGRLSMRKDDVLELNEEQLARARDLAGVLLRRAEELVKLLG